MISADALIAQDNEPVAATVDGEIVMLSVAAGAYFGLNGTGTEIWNRLREPRRFGDLCEELSREFDIDIETITRDVVPFVEVMLERRLLRLVQTQSTP